MSRYAEPKRKRNDLTWLAVALAATLVLLLVSCVALEQLADRLENTVPEPTEPEPTEPEPTEPEPTEPKPTEPEPTEPEPTEPEPTESEPTEPEPTESEPTEPEPTEPEPTEPKPTESEPTEPKPTEPEPTEPEPTEPEPTEPEPTEPEPTEPEPTVPPSTQETTPGLENIQLPFALQEGLTITTVGKYAGVYMEDGSDEVVSNVLMIQVENTTGKDLYLAQIKLEYGDKTAVFQVTNLPDGGKAVLLEQQRMSYTEQLPQSASAENVVFTTEFSMFADQLEITALNGVINVKNISGKDIPEDIYVYYKNYAGNMYYGGITYRIRIEGGLKAGDIRQVMASRFNQSSSRLMMVTIGG